MFFDFATISRNPEIFPDPESFKPERWLRKDGKEAEAHPFGSMPFGFGARSCIGRRIAEQELYLVLIRVSFIIPEP
jgi:cholestanetriol 26-monooxygenase